MKTKILAILSIMIAFMSTVSFAGFVSAGIGNTGTVYTIDNAASGNHVWYFYRASDGALTTWGSASTDGMGTGVGFHSQGAVALTDDGNWLLVVNAGSNSISVFKVWNNGIPTLTTTSPTSSQGTTPISLTVNGNLVYVLNAGTTTIAPSIAGFWLSKTGMLTYIAGSMQSLSLTSSPEQIGFNPSGNWLVVTEKGTNMIDTFLVGSNGVAGSLNQQASAGAGPYGFAFTDKNKLVVSEAGGNSLSSYAVSDMGNLRTISGAISTEGTGNTPCWVAIGDKGSFAYAANGGSATISAYSIWRMGQLNLISSKAATVTAPALDLAFSKNSRFLYVLNGNGITGFKAYEDGSLMWVTTITSSNLANAAGLVAT